MPVTIFGHKKIHFEEITTISPPSVIYDNVNNTLQFSSPYQMEISVDNGIWSDYFASIINIGNIDLPYGYYRARVKANGANPASSIVYSPIFTAEINNNVAPQQVTFTITLSGSASGVSATIPQLKYDKKGSITFDFDDSTMSSLDLKPYFDAATYTDGCGNNISYTAGVAVNGRFQFDNELVGEVGGIGHSRDSIDFSEQRNLIDGGWDILNHSYYHDADGNQTGTPKWGNGNNPTLNVQQLDSLIYDEVDYKINAGVVPNSDTGYQTAFDNQGYVIGTSQGTFDSYNVWDQYFWPKRFSSFPTNWGFIVGHRDFAVSGWPSTDDNEMWGRAEDLITYMNSNPNEYSQILGGTHGMNATEQQSFQRWLTYIETNAADRILFTSNREIYEYLLLRNTIGQVQNVSGNTLTITVDYTNIPNNNFSWFDLSFVLNSGTISNVTCSDSRFSISFNPTTKLINASYRRTHWQDSINQTSFSTFAGSCGIHEDYEHGFDENAFGVARLFTNRDWFEGDIPGDELIFQNSRGGWYFDDVYQDYVDSGVDISVAIQLLGIDKPVKTDKPTNNTGDDPTNPASYSNCAEFFRQYTMRYGAVLYPTIELNSNDKLSGLNLIKYIEIDNEPDRTWLGEDSYYEPEEYAALLSACYDAIKSADPDMKVVMGGLAGGANIQYITDMMAWFVANRTDQTFPADYLQFHKYPFDNSIDWENPPYPFPAREAEGPEDANFYGLTVLWANWAATNAPHCKIFLGEFGYDTHTGSPLCPKEILGTTPQELQARYAVRAYMEILAGGADMATWFTLVDPSLEEYGDQQHGTSGLRSRTGGFVAKDSFVAVQNMFQQLNGYNFSRIVNRGSNYHAIEFTNGSNTKIAAWLPTLTNNTQTINIEGTNYNLTETVQFFTI